MIMQDQPFFKRITLLRSIDIAGPERAASIAVDKFWECLRNDGYPQEDYEKVFGVEMVQPYTPPDVRDRWIGKLTYDAWKTLFMNGCTKTDVKTALWQGKLPEFFAQRVTKVYSQFNKEQSEPMYMTACVRYVYQSSCDVGSMASIGMWKYTNCSRKVILKRHLAERLHWVSGLKAIR
jgi:hypothetical protein